MPLYPQPVSPLPVNPPLNRTQWDLGTKPKGGPYYTLQVRPYSSTLPNNTGVYYSAIPIPVGSVIDSSQWQYVRDLINQERARRGRSAYANSNIAPNKSILATDYNGLRTALLVTGNFGGDQAYEPSGTVNVVTYPSAPVPRDPGTVRRGIDVITANDLQAMMSCVIEAGTACTCNCNYCTCNCNYCTCNCNYACTCDCNYSY